MNVIEQYEQIRNEVLPKDVSSHFGEIRNQIKEYVDALESYPFSVENMTDNEAWLHNMTKDTFERVFRIITKISNDVEASYVSNSILQGKINRLEKTLNQHGIEFDKFSKEYQEGLQFVNDYIKHNKQSEKND